MNQYYKELNITVESVINKNIVYPFRNMWLTTFNQYYKFLNKDFLDTLNSYTPIVGIHLFRKTHKYNISCAHVDETFNKTPILYGLNFVVPSNDTGYMEWFDSPSMPYQANRIPYEHLIFKEKFSLNKKITLIRTDVPHNVIAGLEDRICFSIRFNYKFTSWEETVEFYSNLNF